MYRGVEGGYKTTTTPSQCVFLETSPFNRVSGGVIEQTLILSVNKVSGNVIEKSRILRVNRVSGVVIE